MNSCLKDNEYLSSGSFGDVYKLTTKDNKEFAVKVFKNVSDREGIRNEINNLSKLRHPHIVRIYGCLSVSERENLPKDSVIMEYCPSNLKEAIKEGISPSRAFRLFIEILEGIDFIHKQHLVHSDLKPENILLDHKDSVKIGDLGLARQFISSTCSGSVRKAEFYLPSEALKATSTISGPKMDMYAIGIIVFEMYAKNCSSSLIQKLRSDPKKVIFEVFSNNGEKIAPMKLEVIFKLLSKQPEQRPSAGHLLSFFKESGHYTKTPQHQSNSSQRSSGSHREAYEKEEYESQQRSGASDASHHSSSSRHSSSSQRSSHHSSSNHGSSHSDGSGLSSSHHSSSSHGSKTPQNQSSLSNHGSSNHGSSHHGSSDHGSSSHGSKASQNQSGLSSSNHGSSHHGSSSHGSKTPQNQSGLSSSNHGSSHHSSSHHGSSSHGSKTPQNQSSLSSSNHGSSHHGSSSHGSKASQNQSGLSSSNHGSSHHSSSHHGSSSHGSKTPQNQSSLSSNNHGSSHHGSSSHVSSSHSSRTLQNQSSSNNHGSSHHEGSGRSSSHHSSHGSKTPQNQSSSSHKNLCENEMMLVKYSDKQHTSSNRGSSHHDKSAHGSNSHGAKITQNQSSSSRKSELQKNIFEKLSNEMGLMELNGHERRSGVEIFRPMDVANFQISPQQNCKMEWWVAIGGTSSGGCVTLGGIIFEEVRMKRRSSTQKHSTTKTS